MDFDNYELALRAKRSGVIYSDSFSTKTSWGSPKSRAEEEAAKILRVAGVRAVWVDCLAAEPATDSPRLCQ